MPSISEIPDVHESAAQLIPWLVNGTLADPDAARLRAHLADCTQCREDFEAEKRLFGMIRNDGPLVFPGEAAFQRLMACIEADEFAAAHPVAVDDERPPNGEQPADGARPAAGIGQPPASGSSLTAGGEERAPEGERATAGGERRAPAAERGRGTARRRSPRQPRWRSRATVRWLTAAVVLETLSLGLGAWTWRADRAGDAGAQALAARHSSDSAAAPYRTLTSPAPRFGDGARVRVVFRPDLSLGQLRELLRSIDARIVDGPTEARVYTLGFAEPIRSERELDARIAALRADPNVQFAEPAGGPH